MPDSWLGRSAQRCVSISGEMVDRFVSLSGDASPIHVSDEVARQLGFKRRVVHGLLLGSLVSALVGVELPGERGVLQEVQLSFRQPCYVEDEVVITVTVAEFFESVQTLVLKVKIVRADGVTLATGTVRSGLR